MGLSLNGFAQVSPDSPSNDSIIVVIEDPEPEAEDSTEVKIGKNIRIIIGNDSKVNLGKNNDDDDDDEEKDNKRSKVGFMAFDIGITNYIFDGKLGRDGAGDPRLEVQPFRPGAHVALHFLPTEAYLIGKSISLKTALTIDWSNYYFTEEITLEPRQDFLTITEPVAGASPLLKNKLTSRYFQIPLLLHFNSDPKNDKGFAFSAGAQGGILCGAKTKQRNEDKVFTKTQDNFNLNPWRYGLMARVDLRWFDIYVQYNLSEMFAKDEGPSTRPFNVGLNVIDFQADAYWLINPKGVTVIVTPFFIGFSIASFNRQVDF